MAAGGRSGGPRATAKGVARRSQKGGPIRAGAAPQGGQSPRGPAVAPAEPMQGRGGGGARAGGERGGVRRSAARGVPSRSQKGRSIGARPAQQRAQGRCGSAVAPPQPMQVGG